MCIAMPKPQAAPDVPVPTMQAANNVELGGSDRGAAQVGRLALRLGTSSSAVQGSALANSGAQSAASALRLPTGANLGASGGGVAPAASASAPNPLLPSGAGVGDGSRLGSLFYQRS